LARWQTRMSALQSLWLFFMKVIRNLFIVLFISTSAFAADWTQWRGAKRDGFVSGVNLPATLPKDLKEQWRVTVGIGHSTPLVVGNKIYHFTRQGEDEILLCLDLATGKEVWRVANQNVSYTVHRAAQAHGKGPKSTPVYWNNKIYTLGISGILSSHDAKTGKLIWQKEFSKQYKETSPLFGTATSPVVDNGLLITYVGGHDNGAMTAFDAETGAVKWFYDGDGPAYSSPLVVTLAGVKQVVTHTQKEFVGIDATNGKKLWSIPSKSEYEDNCASPILYKNNIIFSRERFGIFSIRVTKKGDTYETQEVWKNSDNELYMNTPVINGNHLFGLSSKKKGQFFAIDADTGKTLWQGEGRVGENAAILNTGKTLFFLTNDANLIIANPNTKNFEVLAKYTVAQSQTWAHPILLGNKMLIKDEKTIALFSF